MADGKVVISTALDNSGIEKDAGKLKSSVSNAAKSVRGTLGGLTKVVAGVTASIAAAFGAAAVAITKQAVDAYADYEQLIGGVETLFGDAADKVVGYAEDAFYTVGISANEYMETVTSFSASLISSLAGDTARAAAVADMALTDMADNANKMGTPLESIKSAYQGFAKQNYTMLDNLKLGYGGTKTEMERLLKDAQKITGVKYNINNLADVYKAIHAIQGEMGISGRTAEDVAEIYKNTGREVSETIGTTAKEAEKTITGSANMTKAAWKNVLAAIAGGGDLDRAINNLVYSVSKYFENIVPVVERSLAGIGELIEKVAPQLVEAVAAALIKAIPSLLNAVYKMILGLANGIYEGIVALFSGSTKEIEAQLNATDDLADGYNAAADGASNLADAIEEAGKAAKKYLAPFDEITKLGSKDNNANASPSFGPTSSGAATGGTGVTLGGSGVELSPALQAAMQAIEREFKELAKKLSISYAPSFDAWGSAFNEVAPAAKDTADRIGEAFGDLWENDLTPLADYIAFDWAPSIANAWSETIAPVFADVMPVLLEEAAADFEYFCSASSTTLDGLKGAMRNTEKAFRDMCASFSKNWDKYGGNILSGFKELKEGLRSTFETLYQDIIRPVFGYMSETFGDLWKNHLEPLWDNIVEFVLSISDNIMALWNDCLKPVIGWIIAFLAPAVVGAIENIVGFISFVAGFIADIIGSVIKTLSGVIQFLVGVFTLDWERAWGGISKVFEGIWDGIVAVVKGTVNTIIWVINTMIGGIYSALAGVVNGVGSIVESFGDLIGKDWGFSIPTNPPQIPYLAKGAVLPPNQPFLAVVGDQKRGTNVEAPLETIQEAVAIVMEDMIQSNIAGHEATVAVLREILEAVLGIHIGDDVIGQAVARYNAKMAVIRGGA